MPNRCIVDGESPACSRPFEGKKCDCEYMHPVNGDGFCAYMTECQDCTCTKAITAAFLADLHCPPDCTYEVMGHPWGPQCETCVYKGHVGDNYKKFEKPEEEKK